jgi:Flp pilus assembly protein TadB
VQLAPAAAQAAPVATTAPAIAAAPQAKASPAPKLNLAQRLALHKITKKLDKLASRAPQLKQQDASAARGGIDGNLRSAILFGLIGLIVLLFSGVNAIFGIVGTILLIVGLVFLVLWVLDQA